MAIDVNDPQVVEAIKAAGFLSGDEVKTKIQAANKSLEDNRNDILSQLQGYKDKYAGIDAELIGTLKQDPRFERIASDGFDSYERSLGGELQERLGAMQSDFMIKEQGYLKQVEEANTAVDQLKGAVSASELKRKLGMALMQNDLVNQTAVADIERDALDELSLDDKGNIIVMGEDGIPRQTAEGPMRESDWLKEMMVSKPHRFKGAKGGGNNNLNGLNGRNLDDLSPQEKRRIGRSRAN